MRNHKLYLKDMFEAMVCIESFVNAMDYDEFIADEKTKSAVVRKFEILGEASKQIPKEITENYPEISWKEMAGMRDRLIHGYFGIDYLLVWATIQERLPRIKLLIEKVLRETD